MPPEAVSDETVVSDAVNGNNDTGDKQTGDEKTPEVKKEETPEPISVVPEKYELKLPENSGLEESDIEEVATLSRDLGLSNESAQKLLSRGVKSRASAIDAAVALMDEQSAKWEKDVKDDPEISDSDPELGRRVVARFGNKNLINLLEGVDEEGTLIPGAPVYGNNPDWVKFVSAIGRMMKEPDLVIPGSQEGGDTVSMEEVFYGADSAKDKT